jgi:hypothetical protein
MCLNGSCNVCMPSCATDSCGSDGCGGTCRCGTNKECRNEGCVLALYAPCTTSVAVSSECGATVTESYGCFKLGSNVPFCVSNADPCPPGTVKFGGGASSPCLVSCIPGALGGCPAPFTKCEPLYPTLPDSTPYYCVR